MIKSWATVGCMLCIGKTTSRSLHCFYFDRHSYSFLLQKIADSGYMYPLCWKGEKLSMILAHCIMYSWKISLCIFTSCGTKLHPVLLEVSILLWITSWILQSKTIYYYDVSFPYGFEFDLIGQESWVHTLSITFHTTILLYLVLIKVLHHCFSRCFKSSQCYILDHIKTSELSHDTTYLSHLTLHGFLCIHWTTNIF